MGARILVVNDTQEILDTFKDLLEMEGYEPILLGMPFKDIGEVERTQPDLIVLDYIFGGEALGWQMLQLLKMHRSTAQIPIIICTAATRQVQEITGHLIAKGIRLVNKPFDIDDLLVAIREELAAPKTDARFVGDDEEHPTTQD